MSPKDYVARAPVTEPKTNKPGKPRGTKTRRASGKTGQGKASGAKPRGSRAAANKSPEPASKAVPAFRIVFTLMVLVGFGVFLWNIKDSSENRQADTAANSQGSQSLSGSGQSEQDDLPEMPKEEWEFMTTLTDPDYEVPVEIPDPPPQTDKEYVLQCGSFRQYDQADSMKARIALQGLESQIKESNGSNGLWYRVVMGPYDRKRAAEKDRHTLQRAGFTTCRIW